MKLFKSENFIIFLIVFCIAVTAGYYINFNLKLIFGDALVRSFHAYLVFFGNQPKLSAIGFVWPPLQTLIQLPLVPITPLATNGFTGNVTSAIFFGLSSIFLNRLAIFFKVNKFIRYAVLIMFITNPLIFFYGINGMSEIIGIFFILMTLYYFLRHLSSNSIPSLIIASVGLSCSIMTRWESGLLLFVILTIIACIPLVKKNYSFREAESSAVIFMVPVAFAIVIWLVASWLIVGSPIYFLHSPYSFTEQDIKNLAANTVIKDAKGNVVESIMFAFKRIIPLALLFVPVFLLVMYKLKDKTSRLTALTLLGFAATVVIAQTAPIYAGKSYGQLRYYIYVIPLTFTLFLFLFKDTLTVSLKKYKTLLLFLLASAIMITSSATTIYAMTQYGNQEENVIVKVLLQKNDFNNVAYEREEKIAEYLTTHIHTRSILVDDSLGFNVVYLTKNTHIFIESVDSDFKETLQNSEKSKAKYFLITNPETASGVDTVSLTYPKMFKGEEDFVTLEKDFGDWRLYRILKPGEKKTETTKPVATLPTPTLTPSKQPQAQPKAVCEHIVVVGESLWSISEKYLGEGKAYEKIINENKNILSNPQLIRPGKKILIPCTKNS